MSGSATIAAQAGDLQDSEAAARQSADRRRHRRVPLSLPVKLIMPSGAEADGRVVDVSAGGIMVEAAAIAALGEPVVAYADRLGRLEGRIVRPTRDGFVLGFSGRTARAKRLADTLTWVVNTPPGKDKRGARRYARDEAATLVFEDGTMSACRILDISTTGASLALPEAERPAVGEPVRLGLVSGRIVRHHADGVGMAFARAPQDGASAPSEQTEGAVHARH